MLKGVIIILEQCWQLKFIKIQQYVLKTKTINSWQSIISDQECVDKNKVPNKKKKRTISNQNYQFNYSWFDIVQNLCIKII